jgi:hypothetical protein
MPRLWTTTPIPIFLSVGAGILEQGPPPGMGGGRPQLSGEPSTG